MTQQFHSYMREPMQIKTCPHNYLCSNIPNSMLKVKIQISPAIDVVYPYSRVFGNQCELLISEWHNMKDYGDSQGTHKGPYVLSLFVRGVHGQSVVCSFLDAGYQGM